MVVRYFTMKTVTLELHEDLHPHPNHQMWVTVRCATTGQPLGNVQVMR